MKHIHSRKPISIEGHLTYIVQILKTNIKKKGRK